MSLSLWFRDYVYIPLGGNRKGQWQTYRNLVLVFLLVGFWHGASMNFIVWGIWYGFFLVLERVALNSLLPKIWRPYRHAYAMFVVMLGWVFFRSPNLDYAVKFMKTLFMIRQGSAPDQFFEIHNQVLLALFFGLIFISPIQEYIQNILDKDLISKNSLRAVSYMIILFVLFILSSMDLALQTYNPFIYFRF